MPEITARDYFEDPFEFLLVTYPKKDRDPRQALALEIALGDVNVDLLWEAVELYAKHEDYFPPPARLREYIRRVQGKEEEDRIIRGHQRLILARQEVQEWDRQFNRDLSPEEEERLRVQVIRILETEEEDGDLPDVPGDPEYLSYLRRIGRLLSDLEDPAHQRFIDSLIMDVGEFAEYQGQVPDVRQGERVAA